MSFVNPVSASNLLQQVAATQISKEDIPADLKVQQVVRATVVEGGQDRVFLELAHRQYEAKTSVPLQKGQTVPVQVLEVTPTLKLKLLTDPLSERIGHVVHRLSQNPAIFPLLSSLLKKDSLMGKEIPPQILKNLEALQQALRGGGELQGETLQKLASFLGLDMEALLAERDVEGAFRGLKGTLARLLGDLSTPRMQRVEGLIGQFRQLDGALGKNDLPRVFQLFQGVFADMPGLLAESGQGQRLPASFQAMMGQFRQVVDQGDFSRATESVLKLFSQLVDAAQPEKGILLKSLAEELGQVRHHIAAGRLEEGVKMLFTSLRQAADASELPRSFVGQMVEQLVKIEQQIPINPAAARGELVALVDGIEGRLETVLAFRAHSARTILEGALSRYAQGDFRGALELAKVAGSTLVGREAADEIEVASRISDVLQGVEALQLARVKLSQDGTIFMPLLLPFLEHGYLTSERRPSQQGSGGEEQPCMLSLHLKLEGLGNLQVDLLYEDGGILLRFQCEDAQVQDFLQGYREELEESLSAEKLYGITFSAGARESSADLIDRLFPTHHSFEARA